MSDHRARVDEYPGPTGKRSWSCPPCGAWSGFRYKTEDAAQRGAERHDRLAAELDRNVYLSVFGPKTTRGRDG